MEKPQVPPELHDLIERVAAHPHGLGFLHRSYMESVAVTLGVHPFVVDAARAYIETPEGRAEMISATREARSRIRSQPSRDVNGVSPSQEGQTRGVEELIREIESHPLGHRFLLHAPPETIAVTYRVHPFVVFHAREIVRRRSGTAGDPSRKG